MIWVPARRVHRPFPIYSAIMVRRVARLNNALNSQGDGPPPLWPNQVPGVWSQESSESEFVEAEKPWPPSDHGRSRALTKQVTQLLPRPHSHLFRRGPGAGQARGSRHSRRWENCKLLVSLVRGCGYSRASRYMLLQVSACPCSVLPHVPAPYL